MFTLRGCCNGRVIVRSQRPPSPPACSGTLVTDMAENETALEPFAALIHFGRFPG